MTFPTPYTLTLTEQELEDILVNTLELTLDHVDRFRAALAASQADAAGLWEVICHQKTTFATTIKTHSPTLALLKAQERIERHGIGAFRQLTDGNQPGDLVFEKPQRLDPAAVHPSHTHAFAAIS